MKKMNKEELNKKIVSEQERLDKLKKQREDLAAKIRNCEKNIIKLQEKQKAIDMEEIAKAIYEKGLDATVVASAIQNENMNKLQEEIRESKQRVKEQEIKVSEEIKEPEETQQEEKTYTTDQEEVKEDRKKGFFKR